MGTPRVSTHSPNPQSSNGHGSSFGIWRLIFLLQVIWNFCYYLSPSYLKDVVHIWFYLRSLLSLGPSGRMWGIGLYARAGQTSPKTSVFLFILDDLYFTIIGQNVDLFYLYFWELKVHFKSENLNLFQFEKLSAIVSLNIYLPILLFFFPGTPRYMAEPPKLSSMFLNSFFIFYFLVPLNCAWANFSVLFSISLISFVPI